MSYRLWVRRQKLLQSLAYLNVIRSPWVFIFMCWFKNTYVINIFSISVFIESGTQLSPILAISSSEVTVSGIRCRAGSKCRPHRELGYWYCEIDHSSYYKFNNNWDYCCQPQSRCGYSDGYNYPWCMVGSEASGQWRPCSDRYAERPYAYLHRNLPPNATEPAGVSPPLKSDNDVIRPVDSNSADFLRSGSHIIVQTNCTEEWFHPFWPLTFFPRKNPNCFFSNRGFIYHPCHDPWRPIWVLRSYFWFFYYWGEGLQLFKT